MFLFGQYLYPANQFLSILLFLSTFPNVGWKANCLRWWGCWMLSFCFVFFKISYNSSGLKRIKLERFLGRLKLAYLLFKQECSWHRQHFCWERTETKILLLVIWLFPTSKTWFYAKIFIRHLIPISSLPCSNPHVWWQLGRQSKTELCWTF